MLSGRTLTYTRRPEAVSCLVVSCLVQSRTRTRNRTTRYSSQRRPGRSTTYPSSRSHIRRVCDVGRAADGGSSRALIGHSSLAWGCESCEGICYAGLLQTSHRQGAIGKARLGGSCVIFGWCQKMLFKWNLDVELEMRQFAGDVALTS